MKPGTIEFSFLGIAFLALQFWWIKMTLNNGRKQKILSTNPDPLAKDKKRLENLLKK
tara:strand:- start:347 stop:517 length:171 start_codon:yes stop_codon:yes gene_type:complete